MPSPPTLLCVASGPVRSSRSNSRSASTSTVSTSPRVGKFAPGCSTSSKWRYCAARRAFCSARTPLPVPSTCAQKRQPLATPPKLKLALPPSRIGGALPRSAYRPRWATRWQCAWQSKIATARAISPTVTLAHAMRPCHPQMKLCGALARVGSPATTCA